MASSNVHIEYYHGDEAVFINDEDEVDSDAEFGAYEDGMGREGMCMREASVLDLVKKLNPTAKEVEASNSRTQYNRYMSKCMFGKVRSTLIREEFWLRFERMNQQERRHALSPMIFEATASAEL